MDIELVDSFFFDEVVVLGILLDGGGLIWQWEFIVDDDIVGVNVW